MVFFTILENDLSGFFWLKVNGNSLNEQIKFLYPKFLILYYENTIRAILSNILLICLELNSCLLMQKMHPETSREMFYTAYFILIFKNIHLETSRENQMQFVVLFLSFDCKKYTQRHLETYLTLQILLLSQKNRIRDI